MSDSKVELTDREIIEQVLAGDAAVYSELVERYQGRIYAVVYGMVRNREDAREITIDVFAGAYNKLAQFRLNSDLYTWLKRYAQNVAINHLRKGKQKPADQDSSDQAQEGVPDREEQRKRIMAAMDALPADQKAVVTLREIEGMSYKQIAEQLKIERGKVLSLLFYARKALKAALDEPKGD
ncbi:MAG: sigma-70 family RNA polymerase sigma factor [bacterium]